MREGGREVARDRTLLIGFVVQPVKSLLEHGEDECHDLG